MQALTPAQVRRAAASAAPAALAGLLLHDSVERRLGRPGPTAALMAASAAALWVADRHPSQRAEPVLGGSGLTSAAFTQVAALAPGVSRTGATLTALRAGGVDRQQALRTSLLMSLPVTGGAAVLTAVRGRAWPPVLPTALAGVTAYAAARRVVPSRRFVTASVLYRLGVAAAVAVKLRRERA